MKTEQLLFNQKVVPDVPKLRKDLPQGTSLFQTNDQYKDTLTRTEKIRVDYKYHVALHNQKTEKGIMNSEN